MDIVSKIHSFKRFNNQPGLERMEKLLELLDNPQNDMKFIHVAGTNGKGSTCRYMYEILRKNGYKVGIYTSPYLLKFNERIECNHKLITDSELEKYFDMVNDVSNKLPLSGFTLPTEFEVITAIAFLYFKDKKCDYVILETGLGGRLDATNVIKKPLISVIASISYDHMDVLGDTIEKIAFEKAGIIKEGCPIVTSCNEKEVLNVIEDVAFEKDAPVFLTSKLKYEIKNLSIDGCTFNVNIFDTKFKNVKISMAGKHQIENAILALCAICILENKGDVIVDPHKMLNGLNAAKQIGRFEILKKDPLVIIDGAHNPDAAKRLKETIKTLLPDKRLLFVIGMLKDKDASSVLEELKDLSDLFILSSVDNPRTADPKELAEILEKNHDKLTYVIEQSNSAVSTALTIAENYDAVIFCGSIYFIGEVANYLE